MTCGWEQLVTGLGIRGPSPAWNTPPGAVSVCLCLLGFLLLSVVRGLCRNHRLLLWGGDSCSLIIWEDKSLLLVKQSSLAEGAMSVERGGNPQTRSPAAARGTEGSLSALVTDVWGDLISLLIITCTARACEATLLWQELLLGSMWWEG